MRMVNAILIDPFACAVTQVQFDADDYKTMYPLLSHETMTVDLFDRCYFDGLAGRDALFFDDEGLLKPCARFFQMVSKTDRHPLCGPLAGKGLIVGADEEGDSADCATPFEYVRDRARYLHHVGDGNLIITHKPLPADVELPESIM